MKRLDGYRVLRPTLISTGLEQEGWAQREQVPGFRVISCVKRPLHGFGETEPASGSSQVLQTVFSDGLTHVSIFIEPFSATASPQAGAHEHRGHPHDDASQG